ncbi:YadA family autotransporter adhesin [uncultured Sneathia sp.]|uniref:YadA family autotransporter adhesin n=1 Tax=uncultured Sneathia sp. TaxID=278067 RepID=UPI00259B78AD|nr:YadA family autotransporter adhesin [uncultured Sneathia sp.]
MKYGNKLTLIFLIFSTVSMAVIYEDDIENIIGGNRTVISTHGIAFGENSKALDNYKLKNIPIFDKRENIDDEMKKTREETEKRKEKYDSDTNRIRDIKYRLDEIDSFFYSKNQLEEKLKLYEDSNKELKDNRKKVEFALENNPQLLKQVDDYRVKLLNIWDYVYNTKGVDKSDVENVRFVNNANEERNFNLSKDKIKTLLNDNDVWNYLKLNDEKNLKTFLKDSVYANLYVKDSYSLLESSIYFIVNHKKNPYSRETEYDRWQKWIFDNAFYLEKPMKKFLDAKKLDKNGIYESYEKFAEINKKLRDTLNYIYRDKGGRNDFDFRETDKAYKEEEILENIIAEYEPKKKEYDTQAPSMEKEKKDLPIEKEEIEKRIKETASSDNLAYGTNAIAVGIRSYAIGTNALTVGIDSVTLGSNSATFGNDSISIGERNYTKGDKDQVFGVENITVGMNNVLHGNHNMVYGETNTALGNNNNLGRIIPTYAEWMKIDGNASKSEDEYKTYLNSEYKYNEWQSKNSGKTLQDFINQGYVKNNVILGSNITNTDVNNAVVIGNGSKAIENAVSIGNDGITRQIKYVKAGTDDTDAVNVKQLKDYVAANSKGLENINAKSNLALSGVANAIAMSSMTQPREGLLNITGAYGTYGGEHALAVGISGNTERFSYKLGVSTNMRGNVGVGLGFGMTVVSSTKDEKMKRMEETIKELKEEVTELRKLIKK